MVAIGFQYGGDLMDLMVRFLVVETNAVVDKTFDNYLECKRFVNKCRHSRKIQLIFYPTFRD